MKVVFGSKLIINFLSNFGRFSKKKPCEWAYRKVFKRGIRNHAGLIPVVEFCHRPQSLRNFGVVFIGAESPLPIA